MIERRLAADFLRGGESAKPADQRLFDYFRGYMDGAEFLIDNPGRILGELETRARRQHEGGTDGR